MVLYATNLNSTAPVPVVCEGDGTLITTTDKSIDTNLIFNNQDWAIGFVHQIDLNGFRAIRIWGDTTGIIDVTATNANNIGNAGFWDSFDTINSGIIKLYYQDAPRYLRLTNNTGAIISGVNLQYARFK